MNAKRVERAAEIRGIYFNPVRRWLNSTVGYGYEFCVPSGCRFFQTDTLAGAYRQIMTYPRKKVD